MKKLKGVSIHHRLLLVPTTDLGVGTQARLSSLAVLSAVEPPAL